MTQSHPPMVITRRSMDVQRVTHHRNGEHTFWTWFLCALATSAHASARAANFALTPTCSLSIAHEQSFYVAALRGYAHNMSAIRNAEVPEPVDAQREMLRIAQQLEAEAQGHIPVPMPRLSRAISEELPLIPRVEELANRLDSKDVDALRKRLDAMPQDARSAFYAASASWSDSDLAEIQRALTSGTQSLSAPSLLRLGTDSTRGHPNSPLRKKNPNDSHSLAFLTVNRDLSPDSKAELVAALRAMEGDPFSGEDAKELPKYYRDSWIYSAWETRNFPNLAWHYIQHYLSLALHARTPVDRSIAAARGAWALQKFERNYWAQVASAAAFVHAGWMHAARGDFLSAGVLYETASNMALEAIANKDWWYPWVDDAERERLRPLLERLWHQGTNGLLSTYLAVHGGFDRQGEPLLGWPSPDATTLVDAYKDALSLLRGGRSSREADLWKAAYNIASRHPDRFDVFGVRNLHNGYTDVLRSQLDSFPFEPERIRHLDAAIRERAETIRNAPRNDWEPPEDSATLCGDLSGAEEILLRNSPPDALRRFETRAVDFVLGSFNPPVREVSGQRWRRFVEALRMALVVHKIAPRLSDPEIRTRAFMWIRRIAHWLHTESPYAASDIAQLYEDAGDYLVAEHIRGSVWPTPPPNEAQRFQRYVEHWVPAVDRFGRFSKLLRSQISAGRWTESEVEKLARLLDAELRNGIPDTESEWSDFRSRLEWIGRRQEQVSPRFRWERMFPGENLRHVLDELVRTTRVAASKALDTLVGNLPTATYSDRVLQRTFFRDVPPENVPGLAQEIYRAALHFNVLEPAGYWAFLDYVGKASVQRGGSFDWEHSPEARDAVTAAIVAPIWQAGYLGALNRKLRFAMDPRFGEGALRVWIEELVLLGRLRTNEQVRGVADHIAMLLATRERHQAAQELAEYFRTMLGSEVDLLWQSHFLNRMGDLLGEFRALAPGVTRKTG